ncbi:hypothetical protein Unana1_00621 [Umbelopsis nana]
MTVAKRSSLPGQSAIYEESNRVVSPPPLYRSDTPSVASVSPLVTPTASTGLPDSEEDTVKVSVRCRPPSKNEVARNSETCWNVDSEHNRISLTDTWAEKPGKVRKEFLYGTDDEPGLIPRSVNDVFAIISKTTEKEFLLRVSYLEIYNENLKDLLSPDSDDLRIHEDKKIVESREKEPGCMPSSPTAQGHNSFLRTDKRRTVQVSQLNLIDLAGSEKAASHSDRRKEGAFINKSLLTLGTVISKLTEDKVSSHIPYRDSKLTRILQSSLSGNARIAVICTISPCHYSLEESQNTLKFAARVKKIIIDDKALLQKYRNEINDLRVQLQSNNEIFSRERETNLTLLQEKQKHEEQLMEMQLVRTALKERIDHLTKLILTSGSISAKGLGDKPVPSLSHHTKSVPEDQRVDHEDKVETERLRRENTELQIIIDELRETIRTQSSEMKQSLNNSTHNYNGNQEALQELNEKHQERVLKLEVDLDDVNRQVSHLEVVRDNLRAEVERLEKRVIDSAMEKDKRDKEIDGLKDEVAHAQTALRLAVQEKESNRVSEADTHTVKEELVQVRQQCLTLEQERDSLKAQIQTLEQKVKELRLTGHLISQNGTLDTPTMKDTDTEKETNIFELDDNKLKGLNKSQISDDDGQDLTGNLAQLSDDDNEPNEANKASAAQSNELDREETDDPTTIPEQPVSPMFTLGPEIEYIVISVLLSVLVYLIIDSDDDRIEL